MECAKIPGNVPKSYIRADYVCPSCIRNDESNIDRDHTTPHALCPQTITEILDLATHGLLTDGGHHKQYYLEQIVLTMLGPDEFKRFRMNLRIDGYDWEDGQSD
jgi:hypothetical protein